MEVAEKLICEHCGDVVNSPPIISNKHTFCCNGCALVFNILHDADLKEFYLLEENATRSMRINSSQEYSYLDKEDILLKLCKHYTERYAIVFFTLPQIHCSSCIWLLEKLYKLNNGIFKSEVDFLRRTIEIRFDPSKISLRQLVELLDNIGYTPDIQLLEKKIKPNDQLLIKIAIAGFAFGNIMLFSFPEYLGMEDGGFSFTFSMLNVILSLPVLFYSGFDFIRRGWQAIIYKTYDINLPLALGIIVMALVSYYEIYTTTGFGYIDSLAGLIFFLLIGRWYQMRNLDFLNFERDYKSYFPISSILKKGDRQSIIGINEIKEGDELIIKSNQIIPVDCTLLSESTTIDYSFVTGESKAIVVQCSEKIHAGGRLKDQSILVKSRGTVESSYLVSLWNNGIFDDKSKYMVFTDRLSKYFTFTILFIGFSSFSYWYSIDIHKAVFAISSVLIVACPCAIALASPFIYGNLLQLLSKDKIYLRNSNIIDKLATIEKVVFDKTGTLTFQRNADVKYIGRWITNEERLLIHALTFQSTHPLSIIIEQQFRNDKIILLDWYKEFEGKGIQGIYSGMKIALGSSLFILGKKQNTGETRVYIKIEEEVLGYFEFSNQYRASSKEVLAELINNKLEVAILSGDNDKEKDIIKAMIGWKSEALFNKDPHEKLQYILQESKTKKVAMIGDGLNDAGALKASNVGIVIAEETNNFTPASDIIIDASQFSKLGKLFNMTARIKYLLLGAYCVALIYNSIGLFYAVTGDLSPIVAAILMPLSSLTMVGYCLISSTLLYKISFSK